MHVWVVLAFVLPCLVMTSAFAVFFSLMWCPGLQTEEELERAEKAAPEKGLSMAELQKLPKLAGKDLVAEPECAICLEQIKRTDQQARLLPDCNHCFHVNCADTWLFRNSVCPICRIRISSEPLDSENPC